MSYTLIKIIETDLSDEFMTPERITILGKFNTHAEANHEMQRHFDKETDKDKAYLINDTNASHFIIGIDEGYIHFFIIEDSNLIPQ